MKRVWMLIGVVAVMAFTFSCEELEPTPQFTKSDEAFSVTPSATTIAKTAADSLNTAVSFTWNDPKYAVGLEQSKFTVMVAATGTNFLSFQSKSFTGVLTGALTGKELNGMVLKAGGVIGQTKVLDVMVIASQANNNEPKNSNVIQLTVTPYGDLTLTPSATNVILSAATSTQVGVSFTWSTAFNGFSGVKTYQLQYAAGGTSFATPTTVDVTGFSKSFNQFDLNKMALANGVAAATQGPLAFRIKATNELGTVLYSNTATVNVTTYVAYNSIGIIGDATAGGWSVDTDMYRPDASKPTEWTVTAYLTGGLSAKFRADDLWDNNWGAGTFPSGTGTQNGANIPVSNSGYYKIDFNVATGAYSFTTTPAPVFTTVGIIGDGAGGWGSDIDLTKDPNDPHVWTGIVTLTAAAVKFRAEDGWTNNWGANAFPSGYSVANGPNISVSTAGTYFIWFNDVSGEYFFGKSDRNVAYADIGLIGDATAGGWSSDTNLIRNPTNPYKWSANLVLTNKFAKFRADNDWTVNWGSANFPNGVGTQGGSDIPVNASGTYTITFNTSTGAYTFTK